MVNRERIKERFEKLVAIDAESYAERQMADAVLLEMKRCGLKEVSEDRTGENFVREKRAQEGKAAGNLFGRLPAVSMEMGAPILFSAHLDTVSPGIGKKAVLRNGRYQTAGDTVLGADDLSGIAQILEAVQRLEEEKIPHPEIEVLFLAAEEPFCQGSRRFDYSKVHAKQAYVLDMSGKIGEAALAAPAICSFTVRVLGKSAHAGFEPEKGIHALLLAAKAIVQIRQGRIDGPATLNLGTIQGGQGRNIVPDEVVITGEIRSLNEERVLEALADLTRIFKETAAAEGGSAEVVHTMEFHSYRIREEEPVVERFKKAAERLGRPVKLGDTFGGSDNNNFHAAGIRGIVLANGMNAPHTVWESIDEEELILGAELVLELARG